MSVSTSSSTSRAASRWSRPSTRRKALRHVARNTYTVYDLAVAVGSYTDRQGNEKKRWKNIGSVIQTKDGGKVILIDRTFNPAGVPVENGRDQIMVSMFEPKDESKNSRNGDTSQGRVDGGNRSSQSGGYGDPDDEMPF